MSEESGLRKALKDVNAKLELIIHRLDGLEEVLAKYPEIRELADLMRLLGFGARISSEPVKALHRLLSVGKLVSTPGHKMDEISRLVVESLALRGSLNLSQLTREIRVRRGKASRKTVRKRVKRLLDRGIVKRAEGFKYLFELVE